MTYRILLSIAIIAVGFLVGGMVRIYSQPGEPIPKEYATWIYVGIVLIIGYLVIRIVSSLIERLVDPALGVSRSHAIKNFFQIVAAILLVVGVLGTLGPNLTNLLIGAGFIGIVLGLAAQQTLGNLFAGVALISSHPFEIGERLTLIPLGYGLNASTYTHENLYNGYTGVVKDIGLYYTKLQMDDGVPLVLPNSVVIGSLVLNHSRMRERTVRMRIDLDKRIDHNEFKSELESLLESSKDVLINAESLHVEIVDIGVSTYQVVMWVLTRSEYEEPIKTIIGENAIEAQRRLLAKLSEGKGSSASP